MHFYFIIQKFILVSIFVSKISSDSCGNWNQYKLEKCVLIVEKKIANFDDSVKACLDTENSILLTINSKEEQEFITEYLFKTNKIVDNIWIGLKKTQNTYHWIDSSDSHYTNWANGSPNNTIDNICVEMEAPTGKWIDKPCAKNNLVVCQKTSSTTLSELFETVIELRKELTETNKELTETKTQLIKEFTAKLEETNSKTIRDLTEINNHLYKELIDTNNQLHEIKNLYKNKWTFSKTFIEDDGKQKLFIFPMNEKGEYNSMSFPDAVNFCAKFNATLVELQSQRKQSIFESFLKEFEGPANINNYNHFVAFWLNGRRDSSGRISWINTGNQFSYTNWYIKNGEPNSRNGSDYVFIYAVYENEMFGKWALHDLNATPIRTICELKLNI